MRHSYLVFISSFEGLFLNFLFKLDLCLLWTNYYAYFITCVVSTRRIPGTWLEPQLDSNCLSACSNGTLNWPLFHCVPLKYGNGSRVFPSCFHWAIDIAQSHMQAGFLSLFTFMWVQTHGDPDVCNTVKCSMKSTGWGMGPIILQIWKVIQSNRDSFAEYACSPWFTGSKYI